MQKVTSKLPSWDTTKTQSKKGFDKVWGWADKLGAPVNRLSNRIGSEAFWPTTLDKESDKAARILRSFCTNNMLATEDGFYTEEERPADEAGPKRKQRVIKKIPQKVIENAVGLAIFTTMRTGLWISGAGGSGVLVARQEDGSWSPPSGIMLHTAGLGFLVGVDIYDCVLVINNPKALEAFTKIRATLGGEISAVAGPVGMGGVLENDGKWKQANRPVFTYLKSRGFYAGVQVDGTVVIERTDENARFYGETIGVADILAGKVRHRPPELKMLMETLKAAEGRSDVDEELMEELEGQPAPGDVDVEAPSDGKLFGIPEPDDPDPYGVLALQKEGLEIVEAGTRSRPSSRQFEYNPSPSSPIYGKFHNRYSMETSETRSNRDSYASTPNSRLRWSSDRHYESSDAGTQTDGIITPVTSPVFNTFHHRNLYEDPNDFYNAVNDSPWSSKGRKNSIHRDWGRDDSLTFYSEDDEKSEAAFLSPSDLRSQSISAPPVDAVMVTSGRVPPPLPPRNISRPIKPEFEEVDLKAAEAGHDGAISSASHSEFTAKETESSTNDNTSDATSVSPRETPMSKESELAIPNSTSDTIFDSDSHSLEINTRDEGDRLHSVTSGPYKSD
ncbi:lsb3-possible role in the regulation of actin cytoskeletal organization [Trichoderma arundinaceum]|uniref:Lsb3-possible role in the regulation of actin cytoskeletal organization n=1 Tax=Trichoderma arundinaceum TaxID=490622 RepID=A0A395NHC0_TRIAR|nr:lsb3-possible role in the regulation of actin cytoskeletal organization [Trichoderma arundinaceum]